MGPAYCLETADTLLVSGGEEGIKVWKWEDMMSSKKVKTFPFIPLDNKRQRRLSLLADCGAIGDTPIAYRVRPW